MAVVVAHRWLRVLYDSHYHPRVWMMMKMNKLMNEMLRFISLSTKTSLSEAELLDQFQNDLTYSELSEILSDLAIMGKLNRLEGGKWSRKL